MQRHGEAVHVYVLPSSRHRVTSRAADDGPASVMSSAPSPTKTYPPQDWHLLSLRRFSPAASSAPNSPSTKDASLPGSNKANAPLLIVTLLHLPTDVLYAWPMALSGTTNGRCMVTQPYESPEGAARYKSNAVLSESIKVLSDVIGAWIKTTPMREALRRRESKRQNGARRIGQSEQDALWINDGLGLASVMPDVKASALERAWKEEADSMTPPPRSPATAAPLGPCSGRPIPDRPAQQLDADSRDQIAAAEAPRSRAESSSSSPEFTSRPQTPRIEICKPNYVDTRPPSQLQQDRRRDSIAQAIERVGKQQEALENEIAQWMSTATLSDFTRRRCSNINTGDTPDVAGSGGSMPSSPVACSALPTTLRKSSSSSMQSRTGSSKRVSFNSNVETGPSLATLGWPSGLTCAASVPLWRPVFAPSVTLQPSVEEELSSVHQTSLPLSINTQGLRNPLPVAEDASYSSQSRSTPVSPRTSPSSSPSQSPGSVPSPTSMSGPHLPPSTPASMTTPTPVLSSTSPRPSHSRSRTSSKLSQEVPREVLTGVLESSGGRGPFRGRGSNGKSLSPVASFGDLKNALKTLKPSKCLKQKISSA